MGNDGCRPRTRHCRAAERSLDYCEIPSRELLGNITSKGLERISLTSSVVDRSIALWVLTTKGMVWWQTKGVKNQLWSIFCLNSQLKCGRSQMDTPVKTLAAAARWALMDFLQWLLSICLNLGCFHLQMGSWDQELLSTIFLSNAKKIWLCNQSESWVGLFQLSRFKWVISE